MMPAFRLPLVVLAVLANLPSPALADPTPTSLPEAKQRIDELSEELRKIIDAKKQAKERARNEYAKADVSVFYIIDNYGLNTLLALLGDVRDGLHYTAAIRRQLALTPEELEADIHRSLFFIGIFELYWRYVAAFIMVGVLGTVLLVRWRGRSSVSSVGK